MKSAVIYQFYCKADFIEITFSFVLDQPGKNISHITLFRT